MHKGTPGCHAHTCSFQGRHNHICEINKTSISNGNIKCLCLCLIQNQLSICTGMVVCYHVQLQSLGRVESCCQLYLAWWAPAGREAGGCCLTQNAAYSSEGCHSPSHMNSPLSLLEYPGCPFPLCFLHPQALAEPFWELLPSERKPRSES